MEDLVFLVEKIWIDRRESRPKNALGYSPIGFVSVEQEAIDYCAKGRYYTSNDCWAIGIRNKDEKLPEFRYVPIHKLK